MTLPRNEELKACLELIRMAILDARVWGWQGDVPAEQVADLMDAVHNIPSIIENWSNDSPMEILREIESYDKKWSSTGSHILKSRYEQFAKLPSNDQTK
jgi:hypothetical protein